MNSRKRFIVVLLLLTPGTLIAPDLILADDQQAELTYSRSEIIELLKKNQASSSEENVILVEVKMISHATSTRQTRKFLAVSHGNSQAQFFSCFDVSDLDRSPDQLSLDYLTLRRLATCRLTEAELTVSGKDPARNVIYQEWSQIIPFRSGLNERVVALLESCETGIEPVSDPNGEKPDAATAETAKTTQALRISSAEKIKLHNGLSGHFSTNVFLEDQTAMVQSLTFAFPLNDRVSERIDLVITLKPFEHPSVTTTCNQIAAQLFEKKVEEVTVKQK